MANRPHQRADRVGCPEFRRNLALDRRGFVKAGALGLGGIQGGAVIGSSDAKGALPKDRPIRPQDVLATMYRDLGVDTEKQYIDFAGRPHPVLPFGDPIEELI